MMLFLLGTIPGGVWGHLWLWIYTMQGLPAYKGSMHLAYYPNSSAESLTPTITLLVGWKRPLFRNAQRLFFTLGSGFFPGSVLLAELGGPDVVLASM